MINNIVELKEFVFMTFRIIRILCIVAISILFVCLLFITDVKTKIKMHKSVVMITTGYLLTYIAIKLMM